MSWSFTERVRRSRTASSLATIVIAVGVALSSGVAQGRVDPAAAGRSAALLDQDTVGKVTGGGTVLVGQAVASFGLNARRPVGFSGGGNAEGRINYDRHNNTAGRHVNVPVVLMEINPVPQGPNQTGGDALIIGDCQAQGATCPAGDNSAIVYAKDVADSGAGQDVFNIYFCTSPPGFPGTFVPGGPINDLGCTGPEGGTSLRSGNIQVRADAAVVGETIGTASGSGAYNTTPNVNGVELAGGTFGIGVRTAGPGDLEAQFNGVNPLLGLFQQVTVTGWITSASVNGGTMTLSGTATLDMGDGTPPTPGLPLTASLTATGLTVTVGSWSLGTLPMADGYIKME